MPTRPVASRLASIVSLMLIAPVATPAQDPPPSIPPPGNAVDTKPLPSVAIPDDPPPHEGAFFDLPIILEPPDILVVEVLEGLPGRPISGERLIRPDGTISLGFYGDIHVRGLTPHQVKVKLLLHLSEFLNDEVLGLTREAEEAPAEGVPAGPPLDRVRNPFEIEKPPVNPPQEKSDPQTSLDVGRKPKLTRHLAPSKPSSAIHRRSDDRLRSRRSFASRSVLAQDKLGTLGGPPERPQAQSQPVPIAPAGVEPARPQMVSDQRVRIDPANSTRVFVDLAKHNSKFYFVQGDVGAPGRLAFTGQDTVLDALNYAGGFLPTAEPADIHLYRPARGGKPAKDYKIDLEAIRKGDARANLQLFPNDRLVIGRNPIVQKTVQIDRAGALINSVMNSIMQYNFAVRTMGANNTGDSSGGMPIRVNAGGQKLPINVPDNPPMTLAQREAIVKEWLDFLWSISSKEGGAMLDEKAFREALMKKFGAAPGSK